MRPTPAASLRIVPLRIKRRHPLPLTGGPAELAPIETVEQTTTAMAQPVWLGHTPGYQPEPMDVQSVLDTHRLAVLAKEGLPG